MRDLPIPGSPESSTTWPSPSRACCQRSSRSATSCSRPTSGVRPVARASKRLPTARSPSTRHAPTASAKPLSDCGPRSSSSNAVPSSRRVDVGDHDAAGRAMACRRAARFGVSPTTVSSRAEPSPTRSPTTTSPVAMPTRAGERCPPAGGFRRPTACDDRQPGPHRPLGLVLVRARPAEVGRARRRP